MIKLPKNEYDIFQVLDRAIAQKELTVFNATDVLDYIRMKVTTNAETNTRAKKRNTTKKTVKRTVIPKPKK